MLNYFRSAQRVVVNGVRSEDVWLVSGVPQVCLISLFTQQDSKFQMNGNVSILEFQYKSYPK